MLSGFKPVVVAIVIEALFKIGGRALKREIHYLIAALSFVSIYFLQVPFPLIVLAAGIIGLAGVRMAAAAFLVQVPNDGNDTEARPSRTTTVIDDADPSAPEASTGPARFYRTLGVGILLWLLPFVVLVAWVGYEGLLSQEYRFFTVSALVTFGGAYAVLAYVTQAVTGASFAWITPAQPSTD